MRRLNIVDSSGWLEYFANTPQADFFAAAIEDTNNLLVPSITLYEVFKRVLQQTDESTALKAIAVMQQGLVIELDSSISLSAAKLSLQHKTAMADSIIFATAQAHNATLWTQDADFNGLPKVMYQAKHHH